jgi:hypothetical protein
MLVVSTLPHLFVIPYAPSAAYATIVISSTIFSAAWHLQGSQLTNLALIDHICATIWFMADIAYTYDRPGFKQTLLLNIFISILNPLLSSQNYTLYHSLWHLLSAAKAVYIAQKFLHS